jgi:hypothetical protein
VGDPRLNFTSPTILLDGQLIYGAKTGSSGGGCTGEPLDEAKLLAALLK